MDPVHQRGKIEFGFDIRGLGNQHRIHRQRPAPGLVSADIHVQHALGFPAHLVQGPDQLHTTSLAASPGMHLGFHHPHVAPQRLRRGHRLLRRLRQSAAGHRYRVFGKQFLCLVFMKIHALSFGMVRPGLPELGQRLRWT
jgi:hypothetical protein